MLELRTNFPSIRSETWGQISNYSDFALNNYCGHSRRSIQEIYKAATRTPLCWVSLIETYFGNTFQGKCSLCRKEKTIRGCKQYFLLVAQLERVCLCCVCLQNTLVIDTPRVRKQTRHYSSVKEDEMLEFSELESDEDEPSKPTTKPRRPQDKAQGYPRSECFRVEKNLLVYGSVTSLNQPTNQPISQSVNLLKISFKSDWPKTIVT